MPELSQTSSAESRRSKILSTARPETPFGLRPHCVSGRETFSYPDCRKSLIPIDALYPWLLLNEPEMPHIGTQDVDLSLDAEALGDGEYGDLVRSLQNQGYNQRDNLYRFQLVRTVPARDGGPDIDIVVDFLMPRDAEIAKNNPPLTSNFAVQRADGADLALKFNEMIEIEGDMPNGGKNKVRIAVASIPALLAMKGYAINNRLKQKDAYDIYYCIRNYPNGIPKQQFSFWQLFVNWFIEYQRK